MSWRLEVLPEAEEDIREAMLWYERQRRGLGAEFTGDVEEAFGRITEAPESASSWKQDVSYRRLVLRRFPYLVYYAHPQRAPIEEIYLVRLYGSGQDRPEADMSTWPW